MEATKAPAAEVRASPGMVAVESTEMQAVVASSATLLRARLKPEPGSPLSELVSPVQAGTPREPASPAVAVAVWESAVRLPVPAWMGPRIDGLRLTRGWAEAEAEPNAAGSAQGEAEPIAAGSAQGEAEPIAAQ